ncbi:hypothetical protein Aeqsu_2546 [Aequorivita sublithincola DSM 14238]|uniref:DUF4291 domain-containing protein n=1 Tax=Aequorivita sublithincola (strain DSM 14238 / LMG 21431 / ACAM 643 / 9-3) TaxID=746697 RepID=I3YYD4_AEQSU|nr:DUF4291 domain-containing protein [Aequorivita sublithincola]AFL82002.1 hypothetical protein Aeqsu_2546 [Aequorivita sublithincola DSM 14238]
MKLKTIKYAQYEKDLPQIGKHIIGQTNNENIIVYQAFNPNISKWAIENQKFGGPHYKFTRMSWIKPNFLWMMYRAGWAMKEHEQNILAIEISKSNFEILLSEGVHSAFNEKIYKTPENWKSQMENSEVRLQWDPDHAPNGEKLERRAIQIGLKGKLLQKFATEWIISIEDITDFVREQKRKIDSGAWDELEVIAEQKISINSHELVLKLDFEN